MLNVCLDIVVMCCLSHEHNEWALAVDRQEVISSLCITSNIPVH